MSELIASTYEIIEKLGSGGGGNVYLANHIRLGKLVVLKEDKRQLNTPLELLRREVDILKDLSHTYIPRVYDFFVEDEKVYTAMDYIEGESLDKPLKRGETFSQPQIVKWAIQLLRALSYLHSPTHGDPPRGFVHSDIKPANLMRTPNNDVFLIDFNIALALGEENVIGCSIGYASPEHYGLDFSTEGTTATSKSDLDETLLMESDETRTLTEGEKEKQEKVSRNLSSSSSSKKTIVPDIRSDIYSTGATLYHLLKGKRPARNAKEVVPLSENEFSPQIVKIITKAMDPNPDLRYQTADEMLYDFTHLHEHDPRTRRLKRNNLTASILFSVFFAAGASCGFVGLKQMQTMESWLKLAEYSKNALSEGDTEGAIQYALQALPEKRGLLEPAPVSQAQRVLTQALGVYDLGDGFKTYETVELPSAPLSMVIAPDGKTAACMYAYAVAVFDTESAKIVATLPARESALAEVKYLDDNILIYAGEQGITAYDIEQGIPLWTGGPATAISISGDKKSVAAIDRDDDFATVYDVSDGQVRYTVDFQGKRQKVTVNDSFANPNDNLLALNEDGTMLGVSFEDGSLQVLNLENREEDILLFEEGSGYFHFEGGFYQQYFAFSATSQSDSAFAVIDTVQVSQTGGFESQSPFSVQTDEKGIYVQTENILTAIHPVTGEQTPLVTTAETIQCYARSDTHSIISSEQEFMFFDRNANLTASYEKESGSNFLQIAGQKALIASRDVPVIRIMDYENHSEAEIFSYDPSYVHDEARVSADGKTVMLFSYDEFCLYDMEGSLIEKVSIPNAEQLYDQQYIREGEDSRLEVYYNDGTVAAYSATDGKFLYETAGEKPDLSLYEEFYTDHLRIESPLHGTPVAYDRKTGKLVRQLEEDAYLTYVTQAGDYLVTQYITAEGYCYGQLLDETCEVLADLPYLCDVIGDTLIFDYPTGNLRETHIYNKNELLSMAQKKQ